MAYEHEKRFARPASTMSSITVFLLALSRLG
jgi:hypothetical protein